MLRRVLLAASFLLFSSPVFAGQVLIIVDLQMQTMQVRVDGVTRYRWDVSTGRAGFDTPPGRYQPTRMYKSYFSRKYDNAPMPYAIFFHEGYAIHGTTDINRLGQIASHGCVRLHPDNAEALFALVKDVGPENTVIRVRARAQNLAVLEPPQPAVATPEAEPAVARAPDEADADPTVTGSTEPVTISWLRRGIDS